MDDLISKLSEIRSDYNCFNEDEEPQYRALSEAIRILSQRADGDTISRQALPPAAPTTTQTTETTAPTTETTAPTTDDWITVERELPEDLAEVNVTWVNHGPEPYRGGEE